MKLNRNEVHLWTGCPDDIDRALITTAHEDDLVLPSDRQLSKALCRSVLSRYLSVPAMQIRFKPGIHGKPELVTPQTALNFNVSHSGDLWGIAVCHEKVGLDLEQPKPRPYRRIAQRIFSQQEQQIMLNADDLQQAFFRIWTRKEALLKADGLGVFVDPKSVDTTQSCSNKTLLDLTLENGIIGAVIAYCDSIILRRFRLDAIDG